LSHFGLLKVLEFARARALDFLDFLLLVAVAAASAGSPRALDFTALKALANVRSTDRELDLLTPDFGRLGQWIALVFLPLATGRLATFLRVYELTR